VSLEVLDGDERAASPAAAALPRTTPPRVPLRGSTSGGAPPRPAPSPTAPRAPPAAPSPWRLSGELQRVASDASGTSLGAAGSPPVAGDSPLLGSSPPARASQAGATPGGSPLAAPPAGRGAATPPAPARSSSLGRRPTEAAPSGAPQQGVGPLAGYGAPYMSPGVVAALEVVVNGFELAKCAAPGGGWEGGASHQGFAGSGYQSTPFQATLPHPTLHSPPRPSDCFFVLQLGPYWAFSTTAHSTVQPTWHWVRACVRAGLGV
jgi:hypothetical protein